MQVSWPDLGGTTDQYRILLPLFFLHEFVCILVSTIRPFMLSCLWCQCHTSFRSHLALGWTSPTFSWSWHYLWRTSLRSCPRFNIILNIVLHFYFSLVMISYILIAISYRGMTISCFWEGCAILVDYILLKWQLTSYTFRWKSQISDYRRYDTHMCFFL